MNRLQQLTASLFLIILATGCGGGNVTLPRAPGGVTPTATPSHVAVTPTPTPSPTGATVTDTIPSAGGNVALPAVDGLAATLVFGAGAAAGTTITATASTTSTNAPAPSLRRAIVQRSASNTSSDDVLIYIEFSVSKPSPVQLLDSEFLTLTNATMLPAGVYAEIDDITQPTPVVVASTCGPATVASNVATILNSSCAYSSAETELLTGHLYLFQFYTSASATPTPTPTAKPTATPTPGVTPTPSAAPTAIGTPPANASISQVQAPGTLVGLAISPSSVPWALDATGNTSLDELNTNGTVTQYPVPYANFGFTFNQEGTFADPTFTKFGVMYFPGEVASLNTTIGSGSVFQFDPTPGDDYGYDFNTGLEAGNPVSDIVGPDGLLWFTDEGNNDIQTVNYEQTKATFPLPTANAGPQQIVIGPDNNMWFTEIGAGKIGRVTTTGAITEYTMQNPKCVSIGLASGPLQSLWYIGCVAGAGSTPTIDQVTTAGKQTTYTPPTGFGAVAPQFLVAGSDGALWFTDEKADFVGRFAPGANGTGTWTKYAYPLSGNATQSYAGANWIKLAPDGTLWFVSTNTTSFYHVTTSGAGMSKTTKRT